MSKAGPDLARSTSSWVARGQVSSNRGERAHWLILKCTGEAPGSSGRFGALRNQPGLQFQAVGRPGAGVMSAPLSTRLRNHAVECFYYWAHPANVKSILENGVLSYNLVRDSNLPHESLAEPGVQIRRDRMLLISGLSLHSYVPLYLVRRNPMLWAIKDRPRVCVRIDLTVADKPGTLFTDGNAASGVTRVFSNP